MKITHLKVNHLVNPMGYDLKRPSISYVAEETAGKHQVKAQVKVALDEAFQEVIYDSGESDEIVSTGYLLPVETKPETRMVIGASPCFCSCRSTLMPSMPGSAGSRTSSSGSCACILSKTSCPLQASSTANKPVSSIASRSIVRNSSLAPANKTDLRRSMQF